MENKQSLFPSTARSISHLEKTIFWTLVAGVITALKVFTFFPFLYYNYVSLGEGDTSLLTSGILNSITGMVLTVFSTVFLFGIHRNLKMRNEVDEIHAWENIFRFIMKYFIVTILVLINWQLFHILRAVYNLWH